MIEHPHYRRIVEPLPGEVGARLPAPRSHPHSALVNPESLTSAASALSRAWLTVSW